MILVLGEILIDKLPTGPRPGGAPFNFAQHLQRLDHEVRFVSAVGAHDKEGRDLLEVVKQAGLDPDSVQRHPEAATGRVEVTLDAAGVPCYDIVDDVAYDFINFDLIPPMSPDMVYFGSLIQRTEHGRTGLQTYLQSLPESVLRFYDVNFRNGCTSAEILIPSLMQTDILKLNDDELVMIGKLTESDLCGDMLVEHLMNKYGISQIALTRGPNGCALYRNGEKTEAPPGPLRSDDIADTVGAGDSFAAMLTHCILNNTDAGTTLALCTRIAEYICTVPGAVPDNDLIYKSLTEKHYE
ncbi:MAG: carbohydrate kinase [Kiritimatiellia bacterium]